MHRECVGTAADEIAATLERAGVTTLATADPDRARSLLDTLRERNPTLPVVVYTGADLGGLDPTALAGATACVRRETEGAEATLREWVGRAVAARTADRVRLASVVHDLRNPLRTANVSLARLRGDAEFDADGADHLDDLETDAANDHDEVGHVVQRDGRVGVVDHGDG